MTIIQKIYIRNIIRKVAKDNNVSTNHCRTEMAKVIQEAWATTDPQAKQRLIELVGEDRVPTPEEFMYLVAQKLM